MNIINPNDLLARRVIDIARHNRTGDSFIKGMCPARLFTGQYELTTSSLRVREIHGRRDTLATLPNPGSAGCRLEEWNQERFRTFPTQDARSEGVWR